METYVFRRQNTAIHFIVIRPILDLCLVVESRPGLGMTKRWWEHYVLDVEGMQTSAW